MYVCICIYIHTHMVRTGGGHPKGANHRRGGPHRGPTQHTHRQRERISLPVGLYKIFLFLRGFCTRMQHAEIPPPTCIGHTVALLLYGYCAIYDPPPTPLLYAI